MDPTEDALTELHEADRALDRAAGCLGPAVSEEVAVALAAARHFLRRARRLAEREQVAAA